MNTIKHFSRAGILSAVVLAAFGLVATVATADTVNAIFNSAGDVPVTASGYTATGNTVNFTLNYAPATGTDLMVVNNNGLGFIEGTFDNLAQGQAVVLSYGGTNYGFVANYYGGSGNDLVLAWANNRVFDWGYNPYGQLGDNSTTNRLLTVPVTCTGVLAGKTLVAAAGGSYHSLALRSDGTVAAWGQNVNGQLGDSTTNQSLVPLAVNTAPGVSALYGKTVVAIAAGGWHSLALCSDGTVAAWGYNDDGELGNSATNQSLVPLAVNTASGVSALYGKTVVGIAAGRVHSLALCSDGTVAAWGYNGFGQCGDNTTSTRLAPVAVNKQIGVSVLSNKTVVAIAAGWDQSLALCSDGTAVTWGGNSYGELGDNTGKDQHVPVAVNTAAGVSALNGKTVVAIAAGLESNLALCSDGTVAAWGGNGHGQLGDNTTTQRNAPVAVNTATGVSVLSNKTVVAIATGNFCSLATCSDGTVAAWGANYCGELGDSTTTDRHAPVMVSTNPLAFSQRFTRVYGGSSAIHTLALVAAPPASDVFLTGAQTPTDGSFQFAFTNTPGAFFGVLAATNPALPLTNWTSLTGLTEVSPGQFQFTDPQATNSPQRFYRVRSP
jgi:alpha-tubulin suppressor-like RCC1 family protein